MFCNKNKYSPIEKKWQELWKTLHLDHSKKDKLYCLSMFPYPSGSLHLGHLRVYTIADILTRFYKLKGKNVINPIGWDSFGLPAENAANKRGLLPDKWTKENIQEMKDQLLKLGIDFNWDMELSTCESEYYKWTQYLFLQLYRAGLAYKKESLVNWDPIDKTVLANEQVDKEGKSWRSGAIVERKNMQQWFIRITDYNETLENDINYLTKWPVELKDLQKNWIGKSQGARITFSLFYSGEQINVKPKKEEMKFICDIDIFTTCAETIFGVSYLALSPLHNVVKTHIESYENKVNLSEFVKKVNLNYNIEDFRSSIEGYQLKGVYAINPINNDMVPVYLTNYVNIDYGTGIC
jgi:leucyl-tRNA synthetase